jgi:alanine-glyoxylate transaminase/serine-glyoxylate transaminase/serine-pyruvate transaminase
MKAYEAGSAAYFATPPVNLIYAFHASLLLITAKAPSKTRKPFRYTHIHMSLILC